MAGRPRIASNIHHLKGSFKKDPARGRARSNEPIPLDGIGPAPDFFSGFEREAWDYIVANTPPGVLANRDRVYLETCAQLFALKREVGVKDMEAAKLNRLEMMLSKLGLNPSDASRVQASTGPQSNAFDDL